MFEIFAIWRTVLHISVWSGVSASLIVGLGFLAVMLPEWRAIAIRAGIIVGVGYGGLLYGSHVGRGEIRAEWDAANAAAEQERQERDASVTAFAAAKYDPIAVALDLQLKGFNNQVDDYDRKMLANLADGGSCPLGAEPLRLRQQQRK